MTYREHRVMDDSTCMNNSSPTNDVVFGVYGISEWITSSRARSAYEAQISTTIIKNTWIAPSGWQLHEWAPTVAPWYQFFSESHLLMIIDSFTHAEVHFSRGKLDIEMTGQVETVNNFISMLDATADFKRAENLIEWIYSTRGESISVPLSYRPAVNGAYPWLPSEINQYIDEYIDSSASVLILIGPPGTGKTSFIKNLIHRSKGDAKVTYDEAVMSSDSLFAGFIESETRFLIMEDADAFLKSRADGNNMMHKFLNVSDGLISAKDKKLVFSTNLPSVRDIDAALMRPGRCFDVVEFRALTRAEAQIVATEYNLALPDGPAITLAELFNVLPSADHKGSSRRAVGFL